MKQTGFALLLIFLIVGGMLGIGIIGSYVYNVYSDSLSIVGNTNTRSFSVNGINVLVNANWQENSYLECDYSVRQDVSTTYVGVDFRTDGDANECPRGVRQAQFMLPGIDLRTVQQVVIDREISYSVVGENSHVEVFGELMGVKKVEPTPTTGIGGVSGNIGGSILIQNTGSAIIVESYEGRNVITDLSEPVYFEWLFAAGAAFEDPNGVDMDLGIMGVAITPFDEPVIIEDTIPWYESFWNGVKSFFSFQWLFGGSS